MSNQKKKLFNAERKQMMVRVICIVLAGIMIGSALMAALLSQVF